MVLADIIAYFDARSAGVPAPTERNNAPNLKEKPVVVNEHEAGRKKLENRELERDPLSETQIGGGLGGIQNLGEPDHSNSPHLSWRLFLSPKKFLPWLKIQRKQWLEGQWRRYAPSNNDRDRCSMEHIVSIAPRATASSVSSTMEETSWATERDAMTSGEN